MPFEITNPGDLFFVRLYGVITSADLDHLAREVVIAEDSVPTALNRIGDLTAVERFEVGFGAINILASRRRARVFSNSIKSALVVKDQIQFGLARMFQILNDNPQIEVRIFYSLAEAKEWIAEKVAK